MKSLSASPVIAIPNPFFLIRSFLRLVRRNARAIGKFVLAAVSCLVLCLVFIAAASGVAVGLYLGLGALYAGARETSAFIDLLALAILIIDGALLVKGLRHAVSWTLGGIFWRLLYVPSRDSGNSSPDVVMSDKVDWGYGAR